MKIGRRRGAMGFCQVASEIPNPNSKSKKSKFQLPKARNLCGQILTQRRKDSQRLAEGSFSLPCLHCISPACSQAARNSSRLFLSLLVPFHGHLALYTSVRSVSICVYLWLDPLVPALLLCAFALKISTSCLMQIVDKMPASPAAQR